MLIRDERSITVINSIKSIFVRHGIPENVISDNGRQYTSDEFKELSRKYHIKHITSSPKYLRRNSDSELIPVEKEVVITRSSREVRPPDRLMLMLKKMFYFGLRLFSTYYYYCCC